ncbi:LacI family DNA-binding transcriptional regulator [Inquilinus limosus]|uniref:LacI family DNA-binding transcriptional regulator n=1 Tax=Inquilinus limosus TaxID=171674 RepID=UPI000426C88D|nr:LacI family DNA-binding transcriptional regulator [Inquilinus limosus]
MSKRPTIADLAAAAGVSVATVDRVLNQRHPVREGTAERVLRAAEAIGYHATPLLKQRLREDLPARSFGFLLQKRADAFYQQLAADLQAATAACSAARGRAVVEFMEELSPGTIVEALRRVGGRVDALAVVSVDHPHVSEAIADLRRQGVPVFALLTDLMAEDRAGYIGRDNRKEGRTAAWMVARTARAPGKVGIIVGSHRYLCQETAEISFRSYFREHAPGFRLLEPLINLEDARIAREATHDLMARNPDLVGLYICGGGTEGVIDAAREEAGHAPVAIVCNELTPKARAALIDGVLTAVISTPTALMATRTVEAMVRALESAAPEPPGQILVPFELYVSENI